MFYDPLSLDKPCTAVLRMAVHGLLCGKISEGTAELAPLSEIRRERGEHGSLCVEGFDFIVFNQFSNIDEPIT
ncbi:hypothetical protein KCTCHS21_59590 [Cohnella abietis]|uniref:Uncharacterized protein n=1 Tax=Cohnella abietis TaxID=2507935 RepID=A0A3T1DEK7_9BACL|nr:hypothetical protein KCTCHS21_59590 [Cohnella abietis]